MVAGREDDSNNGAIDRAERLQDLLDELVSSTCDVAAARNGQLVTALERTEAACARVRMWLRRTEHGQGAL